MSFINVTDIFKLGEAAYKLWEYGFSKCRNAERQYADFGSDIQYLSRNIEKLCNVIQNVNKQVPSGLALQEQEWDRSALLKICGDFGQTIQECEKLIKDHSDLGRGCGGFIRNIQWNLTIEPEVRRLKDRVAFHNIKIATALKPLETTLMLDLRDQLRRYHGDLASRISNVHEDLQDGIQKILLRLEGRETSNDGAANREAAEEHPVLPRVPAYMEYRFGMATKASHAELVDEKVFPFYKGVNAFHHHFEQSTVRFMPDQTSNSGFFAERTPEPTQYLNLMKSIWIIGMIKKGDEWADASNSRLSNEYMKILESKCMREYLRFNAKEDPRKALIEPDSTNISMLRDEEFRIWLEGSDDEDIYNPATDSLHEILRVTLDTASRHRKQELVLTRKIDTKLQMQYFSSRTTGPPNREVVREGINLQRAYLVPLYANPASLPKAMNLVFRGDETTEEDTSLSFFNMHDLLRFQQAITGYKVVFDEPDIGTSLFQSTGLFGGKRFNEVGRLQIWSPRRLEKQMPPLQEQPVNSSQQRLSTITASSTAVSESNTFSTARTSPITTPNFTSYKFEYPTLSMLVFYLRPQGSEHDKMSLLTIGMDPGLNRKAKCGCAKKPPDCIHTTICRTGNLNAQRITAKNNRQVNLAKVGKHQAPNHPVFERKLKWLLIAFKSKDKRERFETKFDETIQIYKRKVHCYNAEMQDVKQDHVG